MKCVSVVLICCTFWVIRVDSASINSEDAKIVTIVNINSGQREVARLKKSLTLSEARNILNTYNLYVLKVTSSYIFYRHTVETKNGLDVQNNAAIGTSIEPYFTINDIIYGDGDIYVGSSQRDLDVIHIHDETRSRRLKIEPTWLDVTLAELRTKLGSSGFSLADAFYVKADAKYSAIFNESAYTLNEIIRDGKIYIGTSTGDISRFLNGVKIDSNGDLVECNFKVADLKKIVTPIDVFYSGFQSKFTSNYLELKAMQSGITDTSFSASGSYGIFSFSSSYEQSHSHKESHSSKTYTSYNFATYVIEKQEIEIAQNDLQISNTFYTELQSALEQGQQQIVKAQNIVQVLHKYGWYVPIHFKTGGAFREYKSSQVSSYEEAREESNKFTAEFKAGIQLGKGDVGGGAKYGTGTQSQNESQRKTENNTSVRTSVGGDGTAFNIEAFGTSLLDSKKWKIIEHKRLFPTLMLLEGYNNWSLSQCLMLLSDHRTSLQGIGEGVNIKKYVQNIEQMLQREQM